MTLDLGDMKASSSFKDNKGHFLSGNDFIYMENTKHRQIDQFNKYLETMKSCPEYTFCILSTNYTLGI